jgi:hypothetical protein
MDKLKELYNDPSQGFISKAKMKSKLKSLGIKISAKEVDEFYANNETTQRNKKIVVKKYMKITGPRHSYQIDIVFMPKHLKASNMGYDRMLVLINILSRKAFVYPMKTSTIDSILEHYGTFLEKNKCVMVEGDNEFNKKRFLDFNEKKQISVITDVAKDDHITKYGNKLGMIDSFTKNLKNRIRMYMEAEDTTRYVNVLDKLVANYNSTSHSSLKEKTPNEVDKDEEALTTIELDNAKHNASVKKEVKFKIGDKVRKADGKGTFDKQGSTFSKKLYTITGKWGNRWKLEGIVRYYKDYELLLVDEDKLIRGKERGGGEAKKKEEYKRKKGLEKEGVDVGNIVRGTRGSARR